MSGIESLVTQVRQSDQDEMAQLGNRPAPSALALPPRLALKIEPPPKPSFFSRVFCCCAKPVREPETGKQASQSPHPLQATAAAADGSRRPVVPVAPPGSPSGSSGAAAAAGKVGPTRGPNGEVVLLGPSADPSKKTLVLDLDETLVHSSFKVRRSCSASPQAACFLNPPPR